MSTTGKTYFDIETFLSVGAAFLLVMAMYGLFSHFLDAQGQKITAKKAGV